MRLGQVRLDYSISSVGSPLPECAATRAGAITIPMNARPIKRSCMGCISFGFFQPAAGLPCPHLNHHPDQKIVTSPEDAHLQESRVITLDPKVSLPPPKRNRLGSITFVPLRCAWLALEQPPKPRVTNGIPGGTLVGRERRLPGSIRMGTLGALFRAPLEPD
jgi:hypothetical protein